VDFVLKGRGGKNLTLTLSLLRRGDNLSTSPDLVKSGAPQEENEFKNPYSVRLI